MISNHHFTRTFFTDPPENLQLETSAVNNKACQGDVVSINCSADANPSVTSYELLENDTVILDTSGRWTKPFTTGGVFVYKCVANNSVGTQQSASVTISVNGKQKDPFSLRLLVMNISSQIHTLHCIAPHLTALQCTALN